MSEDGGVQGNPLLELAMFAGSFVGLAIVCDDHMVVALETLCVRWNVSLLLSDSLASETRTGSLN